MSRHASAVTPVIKNLSTRLSILASWLSIDSCLIDIGCDHAWLPIWALSHGKITRAIAVDKAKEPLALAKRHAADIEGISFVQSDGFANLQIPPQSTVSIAGMGGKSICGILEKAPWENIQTLILQPNRDAHYVRQLLHKKGWETAAAQVCNENDRYFLSWKATRSDNPWLGGRWHWEDKWFLQHPQEQWSAWLLQRLEQLLRIEQANPTVLLPAVHKEKLAIQAILIKNI